MVATELQNRGGDKRRKKREARAKIATRERELERPASPTVDTRTLSATQITILQSSARVGKRDLHSVFLLAFRTFPTSAPESSTTLGSASATLYKHRDATPHTSQPLPASPHLPPFFNQHRTLSPAQLLMELSQLLVAHEATLTALYTSLSPSPLPLIASHLDSLRTSLDALLAAQLTTATAELQAAEERLAAGWRRVHDWQMALGEQPSAEKKKGDGPVLSLVREVEELRDSMKGRMEERGKRVLQLHQRLRELRDTTGRAFVEVAVEEDASKGWEELDLRLEKMGEMEREVVRCEAEIVRRLLISPHPLASLTISLPQTRRRQLLDLDTSEIFTLRTELGISLDSPSSAFSSEAMAKEAFKDPLDEEILWHLGVGVARQPRREMYPTLENVERVRAKRNWVRFFSSPTVSIAC